MVAEVVEDAVDASADASSRQGGEVLDHAQGKAVLFRCVGHGARYRVVGTRGQAGGEQARIRPVSLRDRQVVGLLRFAMGDGAGLVERDPGQLAPEFEEHPALDQDAQARRGERPLTMVTGVEITSAQGQAITSSTRAR